MDVTAGHRRCPILIGDLQVMLGSNIGTVTQPRIDDVVHVVPLRSYKNEVGERVKLNDDDVKTAVHDLLTPLEF